MADRHKPVKVRSCSEVKESGDTGSFISRASPCHDSLAIMEIIIRGVDDDKSQSDKLIDTTDSRSRTRVWGGQEDKIRNHCAP